MIESPAHDRQPDETRYPNKCEYEQIIKRRIIREVEERITFFSAEPKDTTSTKHDTTVHQQDAVMQQYQHQHHLMEQQAQQQRVYKSKRIKEVPKKNIRSKMLKNTL